MQFKSLSLAALAMSASGAVAADTKPQVSPTQALQLLDSLAHNLQAAGDVRVQLQKDTPTLNAQNVIPFHTALNAAFSKVLDAFPQKVGDFDLSVFSPKQTAALCAALPQIADAGNHATDTLLTIPTFHSDQAAYNAEIALGATMENLSWQFNMLYWSFHDAGAATQCDHQAGVTLEAINHVLDQFGVALIY